MFAVEAQPGVEPGSSGHEPDKLPLLHRAWWHLRILQSHLLLERQLSLLLDESAI